MQYMEGKMTRMINSSRTPALSAEAGGQGDVHYGKLLQSV